MMLKSLIHIFKIPKILQHKNKMNLKLDDLYKYFVKWKKKNHHLL